MKKMIFLQVLLLAGIGTFAQCDKKVTWSCSKTEFLDNKEQKLGEELKPVKVIMTNKQVIVRLDEKDENATMEGDVQNLECQWAEPFKNGTTRFKSYLTKSNGEGRSATITIKGTNGEIRINVAIEGMNGRIMSLPVAKYDLAQ